MYTVWAKQKAFTIVELLIVIVVIAILAAITIVAYNGIQDRAKASAAQSAAKQAFIKIQGYAIENAENYPAAPSAAGLSTTSGTTYEYRYDNAANPKSFCLTATTNNVSYYVSNTTSTPTAGACDGHGVNGVAAITNLVTNPGAESNTSGTGSIGSNGAAISRDVTTYRSGNASFKAVSYGTSSGFTHYINLNAGTAFRYSAYLYAPTAVSISSFAETYVSGVYTAPAIQSGTTSVTLPAASWYRLSWTSSVPSGASYISAGFLINGGANKTVYVDNVIVTQGTVDYSFADGSSPGWIWNGTPNNSTSTGPPL